MDQQEHDAWKRFMMKDAGHWRIDPIHNGVDRDLIAFVIQPDDHTKGIYLSIDKDGTWHCGEWQQGHSPCLTDGTFFPKTRGKAENYGAALKHCIESLGLSFLLALTLGASPYRTLP